MGGKGKRAKKNYLIAQNYTIKFPRTVKLIMDEFVLDGSVMIGDFSRIEFLVPGELKLDSYYMYFSDTF